MPNEEKTVNAQKFGAPKALKCKRGGKWYCVDNVGAATLCVDEDDALKTAKDAEIMWPKNAPYKAVMLCECSC